MQFRWCLIAWTAVLWTVSADAPGSVTVIETAGGAMLGYCATGRLVMDSAPAIIKMIAMTQAKTGRLIKKFAMAGFSSYFRATGKSSAVSATVLTSAPGATFCKP